MESERVHFNQALPLKGKRVLVVEDEYYRADDLRRVLTAAGANVIGPFSTAGEAQIALEQRDFDCAVLDLNLRGESAVKIAEGLKELGKPFLLATGYGRSAATDHLNEVPRIENHSSPRHSLKS